ncbi:hypothetical protein [Streptomyces sp. B6B3]|uniref:hypothetical protein n=1 Tax=Streptomyces sp. B6B3 TaxID=3153570 RepID=UPI00325F8C8E
MATTPQPSSRPNAESNAESNAERGVLAELPELLGSDTARASGTILWRLTAERRQLDANLVRLGPGDRVAEHAEADLDVLLYVADGDGVLDLAGRSQGLRPGGVVWLPRGARRALAAGPDGLVYVTAHRRRPGMTIGRAEPEGGEPACLLHRVCDECGRLAGESDARYCSRCGTALPD